MFEMLAVALNNLFWYDLSIGQYTEMEYEQKGWRLFLPTGFAMWLIRNRTLCRRGSYDQNTQSAIPRRNKIVASDANSIRYYHCALNV